MKQASHQTNRSSRATIIHLLNYLSSKKLFFAPLLVGTALVLPGVAYSWKPGSPLLAQDEIADTQPPSYDKSKSVASVQVNGQVIPIPKNGHIKTSVESRGHKTDVEVNIQNDASSSGSSYTDIQIDSHSSSTNNRVDSRDAYSR
jgi:hypothetical protein